VDPHILREHQNRDRPAPTLAIASVVRQSEVVQPVRAAERARNDVVDCQFALIND
jgi:hypothetical protein